MRILICSHDAPVPPPNGLRLQISALAEELRKRHEVRVLALVMPDQRGSRADHGSLTLVPPPQKRLTAATLRRHARAALRRRPRGLDVLSDRLRQPLREELERFQPDLTHLTMGGLGDELVGRPTVLAALDAWHLNYEADALAQRGLRRRLANFNARAMRRFEASECRQFDRVVVVSDEDAQALHEIDPTLRISVVTNGVDVHRYAADPQTTRDPRLVLFTGVLDYPPNVSAVDFLARRVMPLIRAAVPDARLALVGRSPSAGVAALAELEGVEVFGDVPDIREWLSRAAVYICPMVSGTGVKNKLLEALANGLPCVATPLALQGMRITPGQELLVGTDAHQLASHVIELLRDPSAAEALGRAGRRYVVDNHRWEAVGRAYERIYEEVVGSDDDRCRSLGVRVGQPR